MIAEDSGPVMVRTKESDNDEGGICAGFAVLDNIAFRTEPKAPEEEKDDLKDVEE